MTKIPLLSDLQGPWASFTVDMIGLGPVAIADVYPFMSVTDLKRLIWIQQRGDPRWAPERVFLGVRSATGIRPLDFHWPTTVTGGSIDLPDPLVGPRTPNPALVDEAGNRRPVGATMIGSLILETALSPELTVSPVIPHLVAIPLSSLAPASSAELTDAIYNGFYQLYFPWLTTKAQVLDSASPTKELGEEYAAAVPYTEDRIGRITTVQAALAKGVAGTAVSMNTMVRLRWTLPPPAVKPESLELVFYGLRASATVPFLRFFPYNRGSPLLKLGLKPDGSPMIDDDKVFAQYLNQPAPNMKSAVIVARVPLTSPHAAAAAAFTLYMFEDGTSDISLDVPQRGATYIAAIAADAQRVLTSVVTAIGYPAGTEPVLRDLHATYKWTHPNPRRAAPLSASRIQTRVAALTPFLETIPVEQDETSLAKFQWRAVSNYESEGAQFAYVSQMLRRPTEGAEEGASLLAAYTAEVSEKFGITTTAAAAVIERWYERHGDAVAPAAGQTAGSLAVPRHSTGAAITLAGSHPEYTIEVQDVDSYADLERIVSVVGVLLGASSSELAIAAPAAVIQAAATSVTIADASIVEAATSSSSSAADIEVGELDPALAALMADLGFGGDEAEEEVVEEIVSNSSSSSSSSAAGPALVIAELETAASSIPEGPAPNLEAAVAAVEEECQGSVWTKGEAPIKIAGDYYMEKLKRLDKLLFGFSGTVTGRAKSYSKSCQRSDGRQPNIMTLAEYARVKRCYADRVRFVDLPPRKPADLPQDPTYNPKKQRPDEYFLTDPTPGPTFGKPMWSVYGYANKTKPGEYLYLICSELWCERDNLPILRAEFTANGSACPFCGGAAIADLSKPKFGESVIVRQPKESTGKLHQYVGVITRNKHPDGYQLPCCDTSPRLLEKYLKAAHQGTIEYGRDLAMEDGEDDEGVLSAVAAAANEVAEPPPEIETIGEGGLVDYRKILGSMQTQYILGNDKTLEAGKIGLLPPTLDAFFGQNGPRSLESRGIRPTFVEGATVFVRVGVDNRIRAQGLNLFAGLAPLLGFESAEECQKAIMSRDMVRGFESANYGTLVQEFAARSLVSDAEITKSLPDFAGKYGYKLDTNRAHVVRLYKAWVTYLRYLADSKEPKKLRHIEHLLAQPGTIVNRGLLLVTLEQKGGKVQVVCPSFGIPMASVFGDVPVAFIWHDRRDESWEPIVLYNGTKEAVRTFGDRTPDLEVIPAAFRQGIRTWLRDWRSSSLGCGRPAPPPHVWTPDRDTTDLPRLTQLRARMDSAAVTSLVRDRSNRLAGVLFTLTGTTTQIFVPCLDDGSLAEQLPRVFEADSIPPASLDAYLKFYETLSVTYPGLKPTAALFRSKEEEGGENQIVAIRLAVGSIVPVAPSPLGSSTLPEQQVDAFAWERDSLVLRSPDTVGPMGAILEESTASVEEQLEEAYQHVRLSLSRWLLRSTQGPVLRAQLASLITSNLPLYEKRKRADIVLEPLLSQWVSVAQTEKRKPLAILRQDCLSLDGDPSLCEAAGACSWVAASSSSSSASSSGSGSEGRCLIHAPTRDEGTNVVRIFTARLSDELLRYSTARREILDNRVQSIRVPRGAVRVGDELFLATKPKEGAASILSRLGFTGQTAISFPEEMLRFEGAEEEPGAEAEEVAQETGVGSPLPASWIEKGLAIPSPPAGLEGANRLAFAEGTGRPIETWETYIKNRRSKLGLAGDPSRPFQWSRQDFYVIASLTLSNVLFVHAAPSGAIVIDRWIAPPTGSSGAAAKVDQQMYMILWGPRQLLVTKGLPSRIYRFYTKDLPTDLVMALDGASPLSDEEARGVVDEKEDEKEEEIVAAPSLVEEAAPEEAEETTAAGPSIVNLATDAGSAILKASDQAAAAAQTFVESILPNEEAEEAKEEEVNEEVKEESKEAEAAP